MLLDILLDDARRRSTTSEQAVRAMPENRFPVDFGHFALELFADQARRHGFQVVDQYRQRRFRRGAEE